MDINGLDNFKENVQHTINGEFDKIDDVFSSVQKDGRGNICPVTIILPTLAMQAVEKYKEIHANDPKRSYNPVEGVELFMEILDNKLYEAKDMLIERFRHIASQSPKSAKFMYENHSMAGYHEEEGIVSALKHGTIVIGQLGMAETLIILIGEDQTTDKGMELAKRIENLYLKRTGEFKQEYHLNFGNYYTPAESLCHTAFKKWKEKYGDMENVTYYIDNKGERQEKEYFTNSIHLPVYVQVSPFEKIDIESQLTGLSNAGCITYCEVDHAIVHNIDALEKLVKYAMDHDVPYLGINLENDTCNDCGYQGQIPGVCPKCGSDNISRLKRVTGYITGDYKTAFNYGKQVEAEQRVIHKDIINFGNMQDA